MSSPAPALMQAVGELRLVMNIWLRGRTGLSNVPSAEAQQHTYMPGVLQQHVWRMPTGSLAPAL